MVRTSSAPQHALLYLEKFAERKQPVIGLILGQTSPTHDDIVHLARTPEEKVQENRSSEEWEEEEDNVNPEVGSDLKSVSEGWVADHAKHVTRMLPGGMFVLGIFVVTPEDVFSDNALSGKIKNILIQINKILSTSKYMCGKPSTSDERLVVHVSLETKKVTAKCIEIANSTSGFFKPLELKFNTKPLNWQQFDFYYEFDELYPVAVQKTGISVREQFQQMQESLFDSLQSSVVFFDGEQKKKTDTLESQFQKKKVKSGSKPSTQDVPQPIQVSMFKPYESKLPDVVEYLECEGTTHISGVIASRVFLNLNTTIQDAIGAIKQDVMRSLTARFTMHCDTLIDDNLLPEEKVCFNEPPRRVLIKLPGAADASAIFLCDYLFPGETPLEALESVKEMLDIDISEDDVICNVETPGDTSEFDGLDKDPTSEEMSTTPQNVNKNLYSLGFGLAIFILLIALALQYYLVPGILFS